MVNQACIMLNLNQNKESITWWYAFQGVQWEVTSKTAECIGDSLTAANHTSFY